MDVDKQANVGDPFSLASNLVHSHPDLVRSTHFIPSSNAINTRPSGPRPPRPAKDCYSSERRKCQWDGCVSAIVFTLPTHLSLQSTGGSSASTASVVDFYSKLPKGPLPKSASSGIRARYFDGDNASGKPLVALIGGMILFGYTLDYHSEYHSDRGFALLVLLAD